MREIEVYEFAGFVLHASKRLLTYGSSDVQLVGKPMDVLLHLARNHERLVPRPELFKSAWPNEEWDAIVAANRLEKALSEIRTTVGSHCPGLTLFRTERRKGVGFAIPVTGAESTVSSPEIHADGLKQEESEPHKQALPDTEEHLPPDTLPKTAVSSTLARRRLAKAFALGLFSLGLCLGCWWFWPVDSKTVRVQIGNCDDECVLLLNNVEILRTGFGQQSQWENITARLHPGENDLRLQVLNYGGAIAYEWKVVKGKLLVVDERCGQVFRVGCNENRVYRTGIAVEIVHTILR